MEPHPVPQDILNTEFKLFGSFTLKQFLKLVMACLIGLVIFLANIPALIKFPLVGASILIGIALAIVPRFGTWLSNYVKSIFISPRYVWEQTTEAPEILTTKAQGKSDKTQKVSSSKASNKVNLEEISLEKLLAARDNPRRSTPLPTQAVTVKDDLDEPVRQTNLDRIIGDIFKQKPKVKETKAPISDVNVALNQASTQKVQAVTKEKTKQDYINEINALKQQLETLVRDQHYKDKEADIMHRINDLTHEIKMLDETGKAFEGFEKPKLERSGRIVNIKGEEEIDGQIVFGIVVDKKGNPVSNAKVVFDDENGNRDVITVTDNEGKFFTDKKLAKGYKYNVSVTHPEMSFHTYIINVGEGKLPAYKLRAK